MLLLLDPHQHTVGEHRRLQHRGLEQSLGFGLGGGYSGGGGSGSSSLQRRRRRRRRRRRGDPRDLPVLQLRPEGLHQPLLLPQHPGELLDLLVFLLEHLVFVQRGGRGGGGGGGVVKGRLLCLGVDLAAAAAGGRRPGEAAGAVL